MADKSLFEKLDNFFIATISIMLFSGITVYFLTRNGYRIAVNLTSDETGLIAILVTTLAVLIIKIFEKKLSATFSDKSQKSNYFKKITIIRLGILLIADLVLLFLFNVSYNFILLLIFLILFVLLFAYRPLPKKYKSDTESFGDNKHQI